MTFTSTIAFFFFATAFVIITIMFAIANNTVFDPVLWRRAVSLTEILLEGKLSSSEKHYISSSSIFPDE